MKAMNTQGTYLRPCGPMLAVDHRVDEAGEAFDRDLPAAGHQLALHAASMNSQIAGQNDQHPQRAVGEDEGAAVQMSRRSGSIWNWCIGSILVSAATRLFPRAPVWGRSTFFIKLQNRAGEPEEHQRQHDPRHRAEQLVEQPANQRAAERHADQVLQDAHPAERIAIGRIDAWPSLRLRLSCPLQSLFERFSRASCGECGSCPVSSSTMSHLRYVRSDARKAAARKARNMAADKPAKAPPLYEGAWH